jgi:hypothetical protein
VIQPTATTSKKISTALLLSTLSKPAEPLHQPSLTDASYVNSKIVTLHHTSNSVTASHDILSNNSIIVKGTREKKRILMAYLETLGSEYPELIVTRKKGKISNDTSLHCTHMRPSLDKWYRVGDLHLYNVITTIIKGVQSQFLERRHLQSLFGEHGLRVHCPKGNLLVTSQFHPLMRSLSGIQAAGSY